MYIYVVYQVFYCFLFFQGAERWQQSTPTMDEGREEDHLPEGPGSSDDADTLRGRRQALSLGQGGLTSALTSLIRLPSSQTNKY